MVSSSVWRRAYQRVVPREALSQIDSVFDCHRPNLLIVAGPLCLAIGVRVVVVAAVWNWELR